MTRSSRVTLLLAALGALHLVILLAGFFSTYDIASQNRDLPFAPPTRIHFVDTHGTFHLHPFVYLLENDPAKFGAYTEDAAHCIPIHFFVKGAQYDLLGLLKSDRHLFGVSEPARLFVMGTDGYGRDVFSRFLYGGRLSLFAGLLATILTLVFGTLLGTVAGYYGGWFDSAIMRSSELFLAIPWLYLLFALRAFLPLNVNALQAFLLLIAVIGSIGWARPARLIRGIVLSSKERQYVLAARLFGGSDSYLMRRHILPDTYGVLLTQVALLIPQYVLAEVTLSFLGLGVGEPTPSWGNMLATLQQYAVMVSYWWMFIPGLALIPVFLGYVLLAGELQTGTGCSLRLERWIGSMRSYSFKQLLVLCSLSVLLFFSPRTAQAQTSASSGEELLVSNNSIGRRSGRLVVSLRSEPKTLNPVTSVDIASREVIAQMTGDLIHINRLSQDSEPALAKSWSVSPNGLEYTLKLRHGLHFSDGHPVDADDVVFSFRVYLDENVHSPQRDLLVVGGKPIALRRVDAYTLIFQLAQPYAAAERLFDSIAILPKHLLEAAYKEGKLAQAWTLATPAQQIAGLGPFRLKEYVAGERLTLERNPYYWKADRDKQRLPYLDQITFLFVPSADAEVIRFQAGDTDLVNRLSAEDYAVLERDQAAKSFRVYDAGPSLEYNFLFFNLNSSLPANSDVAVKQKWFRQVSFRQAVSLAIDRQGMANLIYRGRATPLWTPVTPASSFWINAAIPHPPRSVDQARQLLKSAGFSWSANGDLIDAGGSAVKFSILTSASNSQRTQMATMIQQDLKDLGISAQVVPLEFHSVLDRIFQTHDYEAAVLGLGGGDTDPNSQMNVWLSSGNDHVWDLAEARPATSWEAEMDQLMEKQLSTLKPKDRKLLYDRVQQIIAEHLPVISLVSPNILVAAKDRLVNFRPAALDPHTLWNSSELFLIGQESPRRP